MFKDFEHLLTLPGLTKKSMSNSATFDLWIITVSFLFQDCIEVKSSSNCIQLNCAKKQLSELLMLAGDMCG